MPASAEGAFAFTYTRQAASSIPSSVLTEGWAIYNAMDEYQRQGIVFSKRLRITMANKDFTLCDTYPSILVVPSKLADVDLFQVAEFRSRGRLPVVTWVHPVNGAVLARCSQPRVGMGKVGMGRRSVPDEDLLDALRIAPLGENDGKKTLFLLDARPQFNAMANAATGAGGYESSSNYYNIRRSFLNIENIHVMRDSLYRLTDGCQPRFYAAP